MKRRITITLLVYVTLMLATTAQAGDRNMVCRGEVGNGYLPENPRYQTFAQRTFYLTIQCPWPTEHVTGSGDCDYWFNGSQNKGYLYTNGDFLFRHLGEPVSLTQGGYLSFKMSESTNGIVGNEGQRWFRGHCETYQ